MTSSFMSVTGKNIQKPAKKGRYVQAELWPFPVAETGQQLLTRLGLIHRQCTRSKSNTALCKGSKSTSPVNHIVQRLWKRGGW